MFSRLKSKNIIRICSSFPCGFFFVGTGAAFLHDHFFPAAVPTSSEGNWGLSFQTDGDPPVGNATLTSSKILMPFTQDTGEKVIYLTFDAGYENGNTPAILEALTKHQAPATFFSSAHFWKAIQNLSNRSSLPVTPSATTPGITKTCHRFLQWNPFLKKSRQLKNCISRSPDRKFPDLSSTTRQIQRSQPGNGTGFLAIIPFFWSLAFVDW